MQARVVFGGGWGEGVGAVDDRAGNGRELWES